MDIDHKQNYCCEFAKYCDIKDVTTCKEWKYNKNIAEFKKAKQELIKEIEKPFIKILDCLEKILIKFEKIK